MFFRKNTRQQSFPCRSPLTPWSNRGHAFVKHPWGLLLLNLSRPAQNIFSHSLQLSHSQMLAEGAKGLKDSENAEVWHAHTQRRTLSSPCSLVEPCLLMSVLSPCNSMLIFTWYAHTGRKTPNSLSTHQNRHQGRPSHRNGITLLPSLFCLFSVEHMPLWTHTHTHTLPVCADLEVTQWS